MKLIKIFTFAIALLMGNFSVYAQLEEAMKSYNFSRAMEEFAKGNSQEAYDFMSKEVAQHPNNAYALYYLAAIQAEEEQYAEALRLINQTIQKMPKKDKEMRAKAYASRGNLYTIAGDTIQSLADYDVALKINPNDEDILEDRAQILYKLKRYEDSDADYRRIIELNPMRPLGYMGIGRNANAQGDYDAAIQQYNKVLSLYDDYSSAYAFRGESYLNQGKYIEAIDDLVQAVAIDRDAKAAKLLLNFPSEKLILATVKLKAMALKDPNNSEWYIYMGNLYRNNRMYPETIQAFSAANDIDVHPYLLMWIAECYSEMGEFGSAIEAINQAQQIDPDDSNYVQTKADILGNSGDIDGAIAEWTRFIEKNPDFFGGYYRRAFFEENSGRQTEALEDYNMSIMLNPDYAYAYLGKGDILTLRGLDAEAKAAYKKVVELDTVPNNSSCAMYALLALGQKDRAIDFMNRMIENDSLDCGNYYDGACFYSRLGDMDKSLVHLKKALDLGFKRIHHIYADDDLETLRGTEAFKTLMEEYQPKTNQSEAGAQEDDEATLSRVEIPYTPESGCASVKCTINGLPLSFIFDTGASTVSLSMVEANFMLKNGYLRQDDIAGSEWFVDANGDISEGTVVILRNVDFGGLTLTNVRASVVRNQKAPLLLGQSVLGRMGSIEIDNQNRKLIITQHSKSK